MANKTVEMDFWLHLMLSLSCQAPGLSVLCSCPILSFFPLLPLFLPPFSGWPCGEFVLSLIISESCPISRCIPLLL